VQGAPLPDTVTVIVTVVAHRPPSRKGRPHRVDVQDSTLAFQLVYFHARGDYVERLLPVGAQRVISGKAELFDGMVQMPHPDHVLPEDKADTIPEFEPIYPLTAGVTQKVRIKAAEGALERVPPMPEWIDPAQIAKAGWPDIGTALTTAHTPRTRGDLAHTTPARERLAYDELFSHQLTLALARAQEKRKPGRETMGSGAKQKQVLAALPYSPTGAQTRAIAEIAADMASPHRMNRKS